jgi:hypothetical protein
MCRIFIPDFHSLTLLDPSAGFNIKLTRKLCRSASRHDPFLLPLDNELVFMVDLIIDLIFQAYLGI